MGRSGDILGLSGGGSPERSSDEIRNRESSAAESGSEEMKRRRRMNQGADELTPSTTGTEHQGGHGATGIDMGAGGEGTDLE
jgi:hypothetical protein